MRILSESELKTLKPILMMLLFDLRSFGRGMKLNIQLEF